MQATLNLSKTAGTAAETVLQRLTDLLATSVGPPRMRLLRMISGIGPNARGLVPTLIEARKAAGDPLGARMTSVALVGIGKDAVPAPETVLDDPSPVVRGEASWALGKLRGNEFPTGDVDRTWRPGARGGQ